MKYVLCAHRDWAKKLFVKLSKKYKSFILLENPKTLTFSYLEQIQPKYIFFPDWSWIIPSKIVNTFSCVCIHESNLPKFRGGSPLQNQIIRGITKTKSTAFIMNEKLDSGDILLQKDLSLEGSIDEIFDRMIENDFKIISEIINGKFSRRKQNGHPTVFKRRLPEQSELKNLNFSKLYLYNFIRMLSDPYPNAFIKIGKRKIVFKNANFDGKNLHCEVSIE
ncbi:MAG: methionyl-tRNA formyltransferase [Nitrosopumilus sp.]|uniref:formyltransferase family protein n=1 Tax=Nitrosopumilus sp. TaxID=2024843 RepID=UPI00247EB4DA|nr:formyltransferase family protein [Nitrosopumilus sp.]MCV0393551.1 methionyl-tRNA formyltransferase [Nitrosopumilus sp.]